MKGLAKKISHESDSRRLKAFEPNTRILVVDDEKEILESYKSILGTKDISSEKVVPLKSSRSKAKPASVNEDFEGQSPFEIVTAASFKSALEEIRKSLRENKPFAMGFFDVLLGEGPDGYELVKEIHELDSKMYAVFVTAYNDRSIESISSFLGEDRTQKWDYLNKPFSHGEILQKARNFTALYNLNEEKQLKDSQLDEARRQLMESERSTTIAAVARGVSHEFGNLLMQIMGKADLCLSDPNLEKMNEGMEVILRATHRANDILERFKDLSNPGGAESPHEQFILSETLNEALALMEHKIKNYQLKVSKIKIEPIAVFANRTSILQIFVNLTINAIHAMGDKGQVDFTIQRMGEEAEIRVRDYGPGIKPEHLDKVMEPFFTTKGTEGTGLGLPICREIIEVDHRGQFSVDNHGVKGLEVVIRLPIADLNTGKAE